MIVSLQINPNDADTFSNKGKNLDLFSGIALDNLGKNLMKQEICMIVHFKLILIVQSHILIKV